MFKYIIANIKGNIRPPEEFVLADRILVAPLDADKKKKNKKRDLPVINMNGGANAKQVMCIIVRYVMRGMR